MLGLSDAAELVDELWSAAEARLELTQDESSRFFEPHGPLPKYFDDRRSFHRFYLRSKAILKRGETVLGVITTDVARRGIGFLAPCQLLPKESVGLLLPNGTEYELRVVRCRRLRDACFSCGGVFTSPPARWKHDS